MLERMIIKHKKHSPYLLFKEGTIKGGLKSGVWPKGKLRMEKKTLGSSHGYGSEDHPKPLPFSQIISSLFLSICYLLTSAAMSPLILWLLSHALFFPMKQTRLCMMQQQSSSIVIAPNRKFVRYTYFFKSPSCLVQEIGFTLHKGKR